MQVACVGEAMVELNIDATGKQIGFAGDTFNTAVYLARGLGATGDVDFITVLGRDVISARMEAYFQSEGVGTERIRHHPERQPGVYAIALDEAGERSFTYWRDQSAARTLFEDGFGALEGMDLIYVSGITLAILPPERRKALLAHLAAHPARVAFDSNYRPRLWESPAVARAAMQAAWEVTDIALPSVDDEMALFGDDSDDAVLARLRGYGLNEGALKRGADGPLALDADVPVQKFPRADRVVDTTAAGDSFNGGYLAALLTGASAAEAMAQGHALAMRVIGHPGAIVPK